MHSLKGDLDEPKCSMKRTLDGSMYSMKQHVWHRNADPYALLESDVSEHIEELVTTRQLAEYSPAELCDCLVFHESEFHVCGHIVEVVNETICHGIT